MPRSLLRKPAPPKRRRAPRAPTAKRSPVRTGGTAAPKPAAKSPTTGLTRGFDTKNVRKGELPSPTRPRGRRQADPQQLGTELEPTFTPTIRAPGPPPESMSTAEKREQAWNTWNRESSDYNHQLYLAALAYGDPEIIKLYGDVVPTPTGALQSVAREEEQAKKQTGVDRNSVNTFFSGMHLDDLKRLGDEAGFKRKSALDIWEKAKHDLLLAIQQEEEARDQLLSEADREDMEAFEETEPEPLEEAAPPSSGGGGGGGKGGKGGGKSGGGKGGGGKGKGSGSGGTTAPPPKKKGKR